MRYACPPCEEAMTSALPQRVISFYGDELLGVQQDDGTIYAPFARICDNLGLGRDGQAQRVRRHAVLLEALTTLDIETTSGIQPMLCLRVDALPLWLAGIQASRVREDLREKLIRYQREAAHVLWQAFRSQIISEPIGDALTASSDNELAELQQIVEMGRAIMQMAQEQIEQRRRMDIAARVVKGLQTDVVDIQVRLGVLENKVNPAAYISDTQAAEVSTKVKALAEMLTKQDKSKNQYQGVFAELYRRFGVPSYKMLRREQFDSVIAFLDDWHDAGKSDI